MNISPSNKTKRLDWVDQIKGLTIFLVVYGHNFPLHGKFLHSFRMPLFIMIAGFFYYNKSTFETVKKRFHFIMVPYFIWAFLLFIFWFFVGRKYGNNVAFNLSSGKNFLGIFYAQGGRDFMDWGIPLWFLPAIFCTFLIFYLINKIENKTLYYSILTLVPLLGFLYSHFFKINLIWSFNIAMVAIIFYAFGNYFFDKIVNLSKEKTFYFMCLTGIICFVFYNYNTEVDMYRANYGNEFFFIINGISGSLFVILFFKLFPFFKFFQFTGKFSMTILALHLLALSFIKLTLIIFFHQSNFNFSEWEKFLFAFLQIILMLPSFYIINKYFPLLNGGYKKI